MTNVIDAPNITVLSVAVPPGTDVDTTPTTTELVVQSTEIEAPLGIRLTVDAGVLSKALTKLKPAIHNRTGGQLPVLSGVLLETTRHGLSMTASDLDLTIQVQVDVTTLRNARAVLPYSDLVNAASTFAKGPMEIEVLDDDNAELRSGKYVLEVEPIPVDEFPRIAPPEGRVTVLDTAVLAEVLICASSDESRPILNTVCIEAGTYVATDSYRMAAVETHASTGEPFLIPKSTAVVLAKYPGRVAITVGEREVLIAAAPDVRIMARLVEGEFPRWRSLIPKTDGGATISPSFLADIKACIKLAKPDPSSPIRFVPTDDGETFELRVATKKQGKDAVVPTSGSAICRAAFNPNFLQSMISGTTTDTIHMVDGLKPIYLTEDAFEHGPACTRLRLIMPVRVS